MNNQCRLFLLILFFIFFFIYHLYGDLTIEIEYPDLPLDEIDEIENTKNEYIDYLKNEIENIKEKEDLLKAFSEANAFNFSVISHPSVFNFKRFSVSLNTSLSCQLFSSDYEEIITTFSDFSFKDDIYFGFGVQPFTCSFLLYHALPDSLKNLIIGINIGASDLSYINYNLDTFNAGVTVFYPFFRKVSLLKVITWNPLHLYTGFSYFYNSISLLFSYNSNFSFSIDPDGPGGSELPINGETEIQLNPEMSINSKTFVFPLAFITSFDFGLFFMLDIGGGLDILLGRSSISIEDETDITVTGDLADYVESIGNISITGNISENNPGFIRFKVSVALGFHIDPIWIKIPVIYYFNNGISAGIKIGFSY